MADKVDAEGDYSTRIICAELYKGGFKAARSILNSIQQKPFSGKSPEIGLDVNLVKLHAESAKSYHWQNVMIVAIVTALGLIFYMLDPRISSLLVASAIAVKFWMSQYQDKKIAIDNFSKKAYNPKFRLDQIETQNANDKKQNVVIFGEYFPFVGAGYRIRNWNFVVDTSKPSKNADSIPNDVSIEELYKAVNDGIREKGLPNISHECILFADGGELDTSFLLPDRVKEPEYNLDQNTIISEGHKNPYDEYRTYYAIKYFDKARSTLLSTFLRFFKIGEELFVECCFYALPPIDESKFDIDQMPLYDDWLKYKAGAITAALSLVTLTATMTPQLGLISLAIVSYIAFIPIVNIIFDKCGKPILRKRLGKRIQKGEPHNYGNTKTFRESISGKNYKNYFSAQDMILVQNSIEQAVIYSTAKLLDTKGIDSSSLTKDLLTFVNNNTMMYGCKLEGEQITVGSGAKVVQHARDSVQNIFDKVG